MEWQDIKTGDSLFVQGTSKVAQIIKLFMGSPWSHTGKCLWINGELFIIEAIESGVSATPFSDYWNKETMPLQIARPMWPVPDEKVYQDLLLPLCGRKGYDFTDLAIDQGLKELFGIWIGASPENATKRFICVKLSAYTDHILGPNVCREWYKYDTEEYRQQPDHYLSNLR